MDESVERDGNKKFRHTLLKDVEQITQQQNNIGLHSLCERRLKFDDFIKFRLNMVGHGAGQELENCQHSSFNSFHHTPLKK